MSTFTNQEIASHLSKKLKIVSVGSGMGVLEQWLINQGCQVVCIDPTSNQIDPYTKVEMTKPPDYKTVKEYIESKQPMMDHCQVLLNYPLPDYALYDICSIYDLQPKFVTINAGYYGHSGSALLHMWLRRNQVDTQGKLFTETQWREFMDLDLLVKQKYKKISYQLKESFPDKVHTNNKRSSFLVTLMRTDTATTENTIYSPEIEEVVCAGEENFLNSLERCLTFAKHLSNNKDEEYIA